MKALAAVVALTALALAGCQGEDIDRETTDQALSVTPAAKAAAGTHRLRHTPDELFARFDQDGDGRVLVAELPERARAHLAQADGDGDGAITLAELKAAHEKKQAELFTRADKNGDGQIAQGEVEAHHWQIIQVADADADGLVTQAELAAAHASGKLAPPPGGRFGSGPEAAAGLLQRFDADQDGKLTLAELPEHFRARIQASDANGDGELDPAELAAHVAERKARFEHQD